MQFLQIFSLHNRVIRKEYEHNTNITDVEPEKITNSTPYISFQNVSFLLRIESLPLIISLIMYKIGFYTVTSFIHFCLQT